jgi:predicted transposase YbfD/YdcC
MDQPQCTSLVAAVQGVPDPRHRRGIRHAWTLVLTLVTAALASGQRSPRAIGQWVTEHADDLRAHLTPSPRRLPSEATLRRAVRAVDLAALETQLGRFVATVTAPVPAAAAPAAPPPTPAWEGQALDGKAVRGANRHGARCHLVSRVRHRDAAVLAQQAVADKHNEITAAPALLAGVDLHGVVITADAQLTQRALAEQILAQGGQYLLIVKENQPRLYWAVEQVFAAPLVPHATDHAARVTTHSKGHGRLEERTLERTAALTGYLDWPGVGQVLRRHCRRVSLRTGAIQEEVTYAITSLPAATTSAAAVEALWRGHWTIENRVHYVRDVTLGEDAGQAWTGATPQALAALRNGIVALLRALGWTNIAAALRHYGAYVHRALDLLATTPARL